MDGGVPPLDYNVRDKKLVVNDTEAETVRTIFQTYLELSSVHALEHWLVEQGIRSKLRMARSGKTGSGRPFSRGALFHLLRNRLYLGMIVHKGDVHPGQHQAIIAPELFDAVQQSLDDQRRRHATGRNPVMRAPLTGRLYDADGERMSPSFSYGRGGKLYRYYVSAPLQQGRRLDGEDEVIRRVPAAALEDRLTGVVKRLLPKASDAPLDRLIRVEIHGHSLQLLLPVRYLAQMRGRVADDEQVEKDAADPSQLRLTLPLRFQPRGGRTTIIHGDEPAAKPDPQLINALRAAHDLLDKDGSGLPVLKSAPSSSYMRRLVRLAFLAPDLQRAILEGRHQPGLTLGQMIDTCPPLLWSEQIAQFGSPPRG